ncbi:hypothetical protein Z969_10150 [Clostridium novyi A str. 4570]|uniref:Uncharacterized protein n=1 Tax=Clostridium novyi A str. 4570 TaxID=1444290 RepID=A0AA89CML6_CLONO|nr:hypothetical protein [Clostridium novyi]KGN00089.1 hypothetical protein Z969_10150 [Clostridium novyi A str. 4570]
MDIIKNNINFIRNKLQICSVRFKGVGFGDKAINLDSLFLKIPIDKKSIKNINKSMKLFDDSPEIKRISNNIKREVYKFRDKHIIKTYDGEYAILKKEKNIFINDLNKLIYQKKQKNFNDLFNKYLLESKHKIIEKLKYTFEDFNSPKYDKGYKIEIINEVNGKFKELNIKENIGVEYRFYDISEDLLKDNNFCNKLICYLKSKKELMLIKKLEAIIQFNKSRM